MRYILGVFGFIILGVLAVVLISTTTSDRASTQLEGQKRVDIAEFANKTATFSQTTQGKIVGNDDFQSIRISISPTERRIQILKGYNDVVESEQVFGNTPAGYEVFAHALSKAGYSLQRRSKNEEFLGSCPLGRRFLYQLNENGNQVLNLWSSTCGHKEGTFGGDVATVQQLFKNQIPQYSTITRDISL